MENKTNDWDGDVFPDKPLPMFKYMDFKGCHDMLSNLKLMFSNPLTVNDPYDCFSGLVKFEYFREEIRDKFVRNNNLNFTEEQIQNILNNKENRDIIDTVLKGLSNERLKELLNNRGISCFSEENNNLLMWSHYAKSHTGVCIGFNCIELFNNLKVNCPRNISLGKVKYTESFEPIDYFKFPAKAFSNWMYTKSIAWNYENEVRITLNGIDYNNEKHAFYSFNNKAINRVLLGSKMDPDEKAKIIN